MPKYSVGSDPVAIALNKATEEAVARRNRQEQSLSDRMDERRRRRLAHESKARVALASPPAQDQAPQALQGAEPVVTVHRGGLSQWGKATYVVRWEEGAKELPDGEHKLYALPHGQEVDADEAFEALYKRDRRDPSSYDDLAIWRAAWVAGQRALPAGEQEKATEGVVQAEIERAREEVQQWPSHIRAGAAKTGVLSASSDMRAPSSQTAKGDGT